MKRLLPFLLILVLLLCACGKTAPEESSGHTVIALNGDTATVTGGGASARGTIVTISAAGTYELSGTLSDGQVIVDTGDDPMEVTVIFNGVDISNRTEPALHVLQAKNLRLQLATGSENSLTTGTEDALQAIDPAATGAALFAEDDLDIEGQGSLSVCGYLNNGIACKNDLDINSGKISVVAANNGVRGSDSVQIKGGTLSVTAWGDGIKATTADREGKGYVEISGGTVTVEAWGDGIQAATELRITGGDVQVTARGDGMEQSSKALKAEQNVILSGGSCILDAQEDGIRSIAGSVIQSGGSLEICSLAEGIKAGEKDSGLGDIQITGGTTVIFAGKQGLKARGRFLVTGGSVTALCGSDKQAAPVESASYLLCKLEGLAGDQVLIGQESGGLEAKLAYQCLLYVDSRLNPGDAVTVTGGGRSTVVIAA